ncbi:MAG: hypothetical protein GC155_14350 [Alphaproteobacteria bacterium]|nr:hypothetical protein [Alphaproteobacteria bacterium]
MPKLLLSSVVRGSQQGDSHGGLYLVDPGRGAFEQVLDWNTCDIDFEGRGADRGLRGIAVVGDDIFIAASDELFVFDRTFRITASWRNPYLKHCHELCVHRGRLYLTSTGFDSILRMDLASRAFDIGLRLQPGGGGLTVRVFDATGAAGPAPSHALHLNNVHVDDTGVYASGRHVPALLRLAPESVTVAAQLPLGTHNARPWRGGVLFNDTESDVLAWIGPHGDVRLPVPRYPDADLTGVQLDRSGLARQAFGRGLCPLDDGRIAAGSSPTTVTIHDLAARGQVASINLTMDIRNAAHGLAVWPFSP